MDRAHLTGAGLLRAISQAGGTVTVDNGDLVLNAARPLPDDLLAELKAHKRELRLAVAIREAVAGVPGISAEQFEALIDDWDRQAISDGLIPAVPTLRAYAQSFSKGIAEGRIGVIGKVAASTARCGHELRP